MIIVNNTMFSLCLEATLASIYKTLIFFLKWRIKLDLSSLYKVRSFNLGWNSEAEPFFLIAMMQNKLESVKKDICWQIFL